MNKTTNNITGIFKLQGITNKNKIKIKHIDNIQLQQHEHVADTLVKKINIFDNTFAEIYTCNITNSHLLLSKKLPLMYISVIHEKPLRKILLFRVYIFFTISSNIESSQQLLENNHDGKFNMEIAIENNKRQLDDTIDKYPGDELMYDKLTNFVLANEMQNLCKNLIDEIDRKILQEYKKEFEHYKIPTNIISLKNYKIN